MIGLFTETVKVGQRQEFVSNAIKIYVKSVFDAMNENDASLIKFYQNEL